MSITKNPFERPFQGKSETVKPDTTKADVTLTPSKRALVPEAKTDAPKKPSAHAGGGLPPTRKGSAKAEETPAPAPAGFQKVNPFHTTKHPSVPHTKPPAEAASSWQPAKRPEDPSAAKPPAILATTAGGQEVVVPNAAPEDFARRVEQSLKTPGEVAAKEMTGENYQEIYKAEKETEAQQREAARQKQLSDTLLEQKKRMEQGAVNAEKARTLMAKIASLQLQLAPNMDAAETYRIHGEIEQVRVELAQIQFYG